nr:MAG: wsv419-like protein [Penaeus semisulcatus pemonivirus]
MLQQNHRQERQYWMPPPVNRFRQRVVLRPRRLFPSTFAPMHQRIRLLRFYIIETARRAAILLLTCTEELFYLDSVMPQLNTLGDERIAPKAVICSILSVIQNQNWWSFLFSERISRMVEQAIINPMLCQSHRLQTLFSNYSSGDPTFDMVRDSMKAEVISVANVAGAEDQDYDAKEGISPTLLYKCHSNTIELVKTAQKLLTEIEVAMNSLMDMAVSTPLNMFLYSTT